MTGRRPQPPLVFAVPGELELPVGQPDFDPFHLISLKAGHLPVAELVRGPDSTFATRSSLILKTSAPESSLA